MLLVVNKPEFEHAISIARDDRTKNIQGRAGPFLRLEAKDDYVELEGLEASARIPATVYEPGVLFFKVTVFRRLLRTIKGEPFLTIQATATELIIDKAHLPFEANDMLLYADPARAPQTHPDQGPLIHPALVWWARKTKPNPKPLFRQRLLWDFFSDTDMSLEGKTRDP